MKGLTALKILFAYPPDHDQHNHDLVAYVIQKYPKKVVKVSVITRMSAEVWYDEVKDKYPIDKFVHLIGTVSLIGLITGLSKEDEFEDIEGDETPKGYVAKPHDPGVN